MAHIGILCPDMSGHLNPVMSLARQLQHRGHRVTFYQRLLTQKKVEDAGFECSPFGTDVFPIEKTRAELTKLAALKGRTAFKFSIDLFCQRAAVCLREVPTMVRQQGVEAMLIDQVCPEGAVVAEELGLPHATVSPALILHRDNTVPPFFTHWRYSTGFLPMLRNRFAYFMMNRLATRMMKILNSHRQPRGMSRWREFHDALSSRLQLSQQPREFEFPRSVLPESFTFTGPWIDPSAREVSDFPFDRLDSRPLIYASMGTLQNRRFDIYAKIAQACAGLDVQLVIALGGGSSVSELPNLPGDPLVVEHAPQLELLKRATLCITHAGLNTVLECLSVGLPMVALPVTNDQPGVAARVAWTKTGHVIPVSKMTPVNLRAAVELVLRDATYRDNANRLKQAIIEADGLVRAADHVEERLLARSPLPMGEG